MCFSNFSGKQQHFHVTNGKLVYCFRGESIFLGQDLYKEGFRTRYFLAVRIKFRCEDTNCFRKPSSHIASI